MNPPLQEVLKSEYSYITERDSVDHPAVNVPQERLLEFAKAMRDDRGYDILVDGTAVDWGEEAAPRYTVVYHLLNSAKAVYLRIASDCEDVNRPVSHSLVELYPAAEWHERECYDMFGIKFKEHPDMRRILMWDGYPYHPLRKDFPLAGIEVPLPADDVAEVTKAKVIAAPMMGGPFTAKQAGSMKYREPSAKDESWTEKNEKPTV